jgi:hypothetical protein
MTSKGIFGAAATWATGIALCGALGCAGFDKVPESDVDSAQRSKAEQIAKRIYEGCRDGRYEPLGDEATSEMRKALTPEKIKATCGSLKSTFGDYQSLDYVETWKQGSTLRIYRFKGHFSNSAEAPEIRVVMDGEGKLSGFWLKPWADTLR